MQYFFLHFPQYIGLDVSKSSINIFVPLGALDLEIENTPKALKSLYAKLKKMYKKEISKLFEPTESYSSLLHQFCASTQIKIFMIKVQDRGTLGFVVFKI